MANPASLVWLLPDDNSATSEPKGKSKSAKSVIRSRAAAWSHKSGSRKQYARTTGRSWNQIIVNRPATHISPCLACRDTSAKCDGRFPCQRCIQSGDITRCAYEPESGGRWSLLKTNAATKIPRAPGAEYEPRPSRFFGEFVARMTDVAGTEAKDLIVLLASESTVGQKLLQECLDLVVVGIATLNNSSPGAQRARRDLLPGRAQVLASLQRELHKPDAVDNRTVLFSIYLLSWLEILVFHDPRAWMMHLSGMCRVIQHRGPRKFTSGIEAIAFRRTRLLSVTLDIFLRRSSFLATEEWFTIPWSGPNMVKTMPDRIVDLLVQIPGLLAKFDQHLRGEISKGEMSSSISNLTAGMHRCRQDQLGTAPYYVARAGALQDHTDLESIGKVIMTDGALDEEFAFAFALHLAGYLMLMRLGPDYRHVLPLHPRRLVELIVGTCETVSCTDSMGHVGAISWIFPVRIAFFTPLPVGDENIRNRLRKFLAEKVSVAPAIMGSLPKFGEKLSLSTTTS